MSTSVRASCSIPARPGVVLLARSRSSTSSSGSIGEIVEQRAAGGEHQLVQRALQVRAAQLRRVAERVQMRLHPADRVLHGRVRRTRAGRTARILNPRISQCRSLIPHSW